MRISIVALMALAPCGALAQTMVRVPVDSTGLDVAVWHLAPAHPSAHAPVLFVHGASFPTKLAAGYKFDGTSWMDHMAAHGFDVWGLDFLGYGKSDRYPAMRAPPMRIPHLAVQPKRRDRSPPRSRTSRGTSTPRVCR